MGKSKVRSAPPSGSATAGSCCRRYLPGQKRLVAHFGVSGVLRVALVIGQPKGEAWVIGGINYQRSVRYLWPECSSDRQIGVPASLAN